MKAKHRSSSAAYNAWNLVVGGYAAATLGLLLDLPTIGSSGTSAVLAIGIAALIGIGILVVAAGLLQLRRCVDRDREAVRRCLAMQSAGWLAFLAGVLGLQISTSITVLLISAAFVVSACALAIAGGLLMRANYSDIGAPSGSSVGFLVVGAALVFTGVGVILASKIGYYFVFPDVTSTVVNDVGAAISAFGCVIAAYSAFVIRGSRRSVRPQISEAQPSRTTFQATPPVMKA